MLFCFSSHNLWLHSLAASPKSTHGGSTALFKYTFLTPKFLVLFCSDTCFLKQLFARYSHYLWSKWRREGWRERFLLSLSGTYISFLPRYFFHFPPVYDVWQENYLLLVQYFGFHIEETFLPNYSLSKKKSRMNPFVFHHAIHSVIKWEKKIQANWIRRRKWKGYSKENHQLI